MIFATSVTQSFLQQTLFLRIDKPEDHNQQFLKIETDVCILSTNQVNQRETQKLQVENKGTTGTR